MGTADQDRALDIFQKKAEEAVVAMRDAAALAASAQDAYRGRPTAESADAFNAAAKEWQAARAVYEQAQAAIDSLREHRTDPSRESAL